MAGATPSPELRMQKAFAGAPLISKRTSVVEPEGSDTEAERSMWGFGLESYAEEPPKKRAAKKRTRKRAAK